MISQLVVYFLISSLVSAADVKCKPTEECVARTSCKDGYLGYQSCDEASSMICCQKAAPISCGYGNVLSSRIVGSKDAIFAEFPWNIAFLNNSTLASRNRKLYFCGGALIHPRVVLTSAHCLSGPDPSTMIVRAGQLNFQNLLGAVQSDKDYKESTIEKVIIHENFNKDNLVNDIALVIIIKDFQMQDNIGIVCLPNPSKTFDGETCTVSGFGKIFDAGGMPTNLRKAQLEIHSHNDCNEKLRKTDLSEYFNLNEKFICAGGEDGVDSCDGDGGAPLVCPTLEDQTRFSLAGIVSWGIDCGAPNVPGVYVNIARFRNWVDEKMTANSISIMHQI